MLIDKKPVERHRAVLETQITNWDSFEFYTEALDETKVNMINHLFNIDSISDPNSVCHKTFKDERVGYGRSNLWQHNGLRWENT